jgi:hypothetical protein
VKDKKTFESEAPSDPLVGSERKAAAASTPGPQSKHEQRNSRADKMILAGAWLIALSLVFLAGYLAWQTQIQSAVANAPTQVFSAAPSTEVSVPAFAPAVSSEGSGQLVLPAFEKNEGLQSITRRTDLHTIIPTRPRDSVITYTVSLGDSVFSISKKFNIKPETVLWANYNLLKDSPDMLSVDMDLFIPPVDGVYYQWVEGDSLGNVAWRFKVEEEDIINWPGNDLDLVEPTILPGQMVLIPGGQREFVQWIVPTIPRGKAGVSKSVYGPGACEGSYEGAYGGGSFVWPSANRVLSGNDYWSGHLGIDIAAGIGDGVFATDSGVIVFAGWAYGGYGNMVQIDHGNGYQSVYAHMSSVTARCGQSVYQGSYIGAAGSTGNSTGPHLHFEVRYMGGFINPWHVLP